MWIGLGRGGGVTGEYMRRGARGPDTPPLGGSTFLLEGGGVGLDVGSSCFPNNQFDDVVAIGEGSPY